MSGLRVLATAVVALLWTTAPLHGQTPERYEPTVGMAGKDSVWVPTPAALIEEMLDLAEVTPNDYVIDLGSGDGRMVVAAARRGARALGVEFNPDLVKLSRQVASDEGVGERATFVEGDMFAADLSEATVLALFMLPDHYRKLTPKFLELAPGTRIVVNTFGIPDWNPDATSRTAGECGSWCEAKLYIVPAPVAGTWDLPRGSLVLEQSFQQVSGTISRDESDIPIAEGAVKGRDISFIAGGDRYAGRINGDTIEGTTTSGGTEQPFIARRRQETGSGAQQR